MSELELELSRRGFLARAGAGLAGFSAVLSLLEAVDADAARAQLPDGVVPIADGGPVRATIAAIADTVVPGPAGGADRHPGAVEAGAVDEVYDDFYGIAATFPVIHADIEAATPLVLGRPASFDLALDYRDREQVLANRIRATGNSGANPLNVAYAALAIVVWFAYYGTAQSTKGVEYIRFPPQSDGYWPGHSRRIRFRGMTRNGNPR